MAAATAHLLMTGLILDSKNTILLESLREPPTSHAYKLVEGALSVMYITDPMGARFFTCMFWEGKK
jgi:hypothetical protein